MSMFDPASWALIVHLSQLAGSEIEIAEALDFGTGVFALFLFALSIFAYSRRKQFPLLIVSLAFFLFFLEHLIGLLSEMVEFYEPSGVLRLGLIFMDFIILLLFFLAVVIRPRRKTLGSP